MRTKQLYIFYVFFAIGCIVALSPLMWSIHEAGHLQSFTLDKIPAEITAPNITTTSRITFHGLAAGSLAEFVTCWLLCWLLLALSNREAMSIRRFWFPIGAPLGACTIIFFKAFYYTDFNREWASDLQTTWVAVVLPMLIFIWIIVILTRLRYPDTI